jgi:hypothetical protein
MDYDMLILLTSVEPALINF